LYENYHILVKFEFQFFLEPTVSGAAVWDSAPNRNLSALVLEAPVEMLPSFRRPPYARPILDVIKGIPSYWVEVERGGSFLVDRAHG
jgi:hypothetical protein